MSLGALEMWKGVTDHRNVSHYEDRRRYSIFCKGNGANRRVDGVKGGAH